MMFGDTLMTLGSTVMWLVMFWMHCLVAAIFKSLRRTSNLRTNGWGFGRLRRSLPDVLGIRV